LDTHSVVRGLSSYPRGLKAYQIGLYGSIAAICNTYDALMTVRPYAGEQSPSAAVNILLTERLKPILVVLLDPTGRPMRSRQILALAKDPKMSANEPYRIRCTLEQSRLEFDPRELFV
jgi:hypothetical protein